jgi:hypothetical protein
MALTALMVPIVSLHQPHVLRLSRRTPPARRVRSSKIRDYLPDTDSCIPHSAVIPPSTNSRAPVT